MSDYIHCLILIEPESNLNIKEPEKEMKTKGRSAPVRYALLPTESMNHPFCKILTENGIKLINEDHVTPPKSLKLQVLDLFLDYKIKDAQTEQIRLYLDLSIEDFVQELLSQGNNAVRVVNVSHVLVCRSKSAVEEKINLNVLEKLLVAKVDMTPLYPNGRSFLHIAANGNLRSLTQLLIKHGANVNATQEDGATPFHIAARNYSSVIIDILLDNGARIDARMQDGSVPLHEAVKGGFVHLVKELLKRGAEVEVKSEDGSTPLHHATKKGSLEMVQLLIEKGAQVTAKTKDGVTPLHIVAGLGLGSKFIPIVKLLLQKGADVHSTDSEGDTPLHYSVKMYPDVLKLLIECGADINTENKDSETALLKAVTRGWSIPYEYLLSLNPDVNVNGNRKAFLVALCKDGEKFKILVEQMIQQGFRVVAEDASNPEVLFGAIHKRRVEILQSLLAFGANVHKYCTFIRLKLTPLHYAIRTNQQDMVQLLLDYGADVNGERGPSKHKRTPITDAAECASLEIMHMLLEKGAKLSNEPTLLHLAAEEAGSDVIQFLLEKGFHWNAKNKKGETPLSIAVHGANLEAIKIMVKFGALVDISYLPKQSGRMFNDSSVLELFLQFCFARPNLAGETTIRKLFGHNFGHVSANRSCAEILAKHLIKIGVVNETLCARDLIPSHHFENFSLVDIENQCKQETEDMKLVKVGWTDVTVYDVLIKSVSQIACFARNQHFCRSLNFVGRRYPIYTSILTLKISMGVVRRQLLDHGMKILGFFCRYFLALPHDLKEIVINYLNNQDLFILQKCLPVGKSD